MGREALTWMPVVLLVLLVVVLTLPGAVVPGIVLAVFGRWAARAPRPYGAAA